MVNWLCYTRGPNDLYHIHFLTSSNHCRHHTWVWFMDISKMVHKGGKGVKNIQKMLTWFADDPGYDESFY